MNLSSFLNSDFLLLSIALLPLLIAFGKKRRYFLNLFLPAETLTIFLVQLLKKITASPRPFFYQPKVLGVTSNIPQDYSFPSLHTAIATLFAWILTFLYPRLSWLWFATLTVIAVSRVKLGLHYPKDIAAGFFLATAVFWFIYLLSHSRKALAWGQDPNIRRKLVHLFYGLILVFALDSRLLSTKTFFLWLLFSFSLFILSPFLPLSFRQIINYFEREKKKKFLALGPFLFTLSSFITWFIFPPHIALAAILGLAIGDSVNALAGSFFPGKKKKLEAGLAAFFATLLLSSQYISLPLATGGSLITFILEISEPKIKGKEVDDNLLIPPVFALSVYLIKSFF